MPIITFKCPDCGKQVEHIVPMSRVKDGENLFTDCEKCGSIALSVLSVPSPMQWGCRKGF